MQTETDTRTTPTGFWTVSDFCPVETLETVPPFYSVFEITFTRQQKSRTLQVKTENCLCLDSVRTAALERWGFIPRLQLDELPKDQQAREWLWMLQKAQHEGPK